MGPGALVVVHGGHELQLAEGFLVAVRFGPDHHVAGHEDGGLDLPLVYVLGQASRLEVLGERYPGGEVVLIDSLVGESLFGVDVFGAELRG